jgi:glycosyltransferase involved in cell wall biosynthesis
MRVAWYSNAPWVPSGYGQQTAEVLPLLCDKYGTDNVAVTNNHGLNGQAQRWNGVRVFPCGLDLFSDEVAPVYADWFFQGEPGFIVTLYDQFVLKNPAWSQLNVAAWTPVDRDPVSPLTVEWFKQTRAVPLAMSRFGETQLRNVGLDPSYVPHSVNTNIFRPQPADPARFGIPEGKFVVGMVAYNKGNPSRKAFPEVFQAFGRFLLEHPDAVLYVHSEQHGIGDGIDLELLACMCGIEDQVVFADQLQYRLGDPAEKMAALYSTFDVLLAPSYGEGFGIPVVEAQACGTPVIVSDFTSQPELVGHGWTVNGQRFADMDRQSWFQIPNVAEITAALHKAASTKPDPEKARKFAMQYDTNRVWRKYWLPTLARIESRFPNIEPVVSAHGVPTERVTL